MAKTRPRNAELRAAREARQAAESKETLEASSVKKPSTDEPSRGSVSNIVRDSE